VAAQKSEKVWAWIEPFAAYGFNKAHSASYGRVAYQTAYMKANYPVEYMARCSPPSRRHRHGVDHGRRVQAHGHPVLPPDVNESFGDFTVIAPTLFALVSTRLKTLAAALPTRY
jgi:DNA polymerase-3 subunit alpha